MATASLALPLSMDGHTTQEPRLWWSALREAMGQLAGRVDLKHIVALSVNGTSSTMLAVDAQGEPVGPALMYNDNACIAEAAQVAVYAPADSAAIGRSSGLAKWLWLKRRYPKSTVLHQADWVAQRLGAKQMTSDENNALKTGYDPLLRAWPLWLKNIVDFNELLCIVPPGTYLGQCNTPFARELRLNPDTQVVAGTTDSVAAFIASGACEVGDATTSLGSTLAIKLISAAPVNAAQFGVYSHRLGALWLAGGASNSGGSALLQYFSTGRMNTLSELLNPDIDTGLDYYPLPKEGERFPISDPAMAPRLSPRPAEDSVFFQGMLEGIARIEAQAYQRLHALGASPVRSIRTVGGGARNLAWQRIRARILPAPLHPATQLEAAYGSALLAKRGHDPA